jgi:hypothetical protein
LLCPPVFTKKYGIGRLSWIPFLKRSLLLSFDYANIFIEKEMLFRSPGDHGLFIRMDSALNSFAAAFVQQAGIM